jgi:DNA-binding IclR family transcriptional regulator
MIEKKNNEYIVPALERGLRILGEFNAGTQTLNPTDIAKRLGIPRASAFRMMQTLERLGFLTRVNEGGDYRLGVAVLRLGYEYISSLELVELGLPIINSLRDLTGCSAHVTVRDGRDVVFLAKAASPAAIFTSIHIGTRLPAHATVLGRLLLSDLTDEALDALYPEETLKVFSPQTPRTLPELKALLEVDRRRGYVISQSFFEQGLSVVGAPVHDHRGAVVAAISIAIHSASIDPAQQENFCQEVLASAKKLSEILKYQLEAPKVSHIKRPAVLKGEVAR